MELKHIFFTGDFQVGKSTALNNYLKNFKESEIVRFVTTTRKDSEDSKTVFINGFEAGKLRNHKVVYAYPEIFNTVGVKALERKPETKVIAVDEIGLLEKNADKFCDEILRLLDQTEIQVAGVLRKSADTPLAERIRNHRNVDLIEIKN